MKRILIHIIARYYLWKFRRQDPNAKYRIKIANSGSVYIQRKNNRSVYKTRLRISDHLPKNRHGNRRSVHSKKVGIIV